MGLFSSSKSTSLTTNTANRGAADNGSLVATGQSNITYTEDSEKALDLSRSTIAQAFDSLEASNRRADEITKLALKQSERVSVPETRIITESVAQKALPISIIVIGLVAWSMTR